MGTLEDISRPCLIESFTSVLLTGIHQGIVAFMWNLMNLMGSIVLGLIMGTSALVPVVIGLVDLVIAVTILCAVIFQSTYLPHSQSDCRYADTWKTANGTSNFFQVASSLSHSTPRDVCCEYVTNWILGIVVM